MKHAIIVGHPDPDSFNLAVARTYAEAATAKGHEVVLRDLYRMDFDPRLKLEELPRPGGFAPAPDVLAERALLDGCEVFAFVYPLWFYAPPAIVKGYVDRVFGMGFGYGPVKDGGNQPLLGFRKMISFTSSGAPEDWLQREGALSAMRRVFDDHLSGVTGLQVVDHLHFGGITPGLRTDAVLGELERVRGAVSRCF